MLVGSDDGGIDVVDFPVQLALGIGPSLNGLQDAIPDTSLASAVEAGGHRPWRAVSLGQISPRRTRAKDPRDAVDDAPMVFGGTPGMRFLRREYRLQPLPLVVGQVSSVHTLSMPEFEKTP